MVNLLAYGKSIALNASNAGSVHWSPDRRILYLLKYPLPERVAFPAMRATVPCSLARADPRPPVFVPHRGTRRVPACLQRVPCCRLC